MSASYRGNSSRGRGLPFTPRGGHGQYGNGRGYTGGSHHRGRGNRGGRGSLSTPRDQWGYLNDEDRLPSEAALKVEQDFQDRKNASHESIGRSSRPIRPAYTTEGPAVQLYANLFHVDIMPIKVFGYTVTIDSTVRGEKRKRLVAQSIEALPRDVQPSIASDCKTILYSSKELPQSASFRLIDQLEAAEFTALKEASPSLEDDRKTELVRALQVIMSSEAVQKTLEWPSAMMERGPSRHYAIGKAIHCESKPLGDGFVLVRGFFHSVRHSSSGPLLQMQPKAALAYKRLRLDEWIKEARLYDGDAHAYDLLKRLRVLPVHISPSKLRKDALGQPIPKVILGVVAKSPAESKEDFSKPYIPRLGAGPTEVQFPIRAHDGSLSRVSVFDYFRKTYPHVKIDTKLPTICTGSKDRPTFYPAEALEILPGQPYRGELTPMQMQKMLDFTVKLPPDNFTLVAEKSQQMIGLVRAQSELPTTPKNFGISLETKMLKVEAHVKILPEVLYASDVPRQTARGWNLREVKFTRNGDAVKKWSVLCIKSGDSDTKFNDLHAMLKGFAKQVRGHGVNINDKPQRTKHIIIHDGEGGAEPKEEFLIKLDSTLREIAPGAEFILVLSSLLTAAIFKRVKLHAETELGVRNLFVSVEKFAQCQLQYFSNLAMKLNLQFGGSNHSVADLPLIGEGKTMLVGMDVVHGNTHVSDKENMTRSRGAIVASIRGDVGQFPGEVFDLEPRQEKITVLADIFHRRLELWQKHNKGVLPRKIIIFRDGVSEGQYGMVLETELSGVQESCNRHYAENKQARPSITLVICTKRQNTRFYPTQEAQKMPGMIDKNGNVAQGTVVDRIITEPKVWDFYQVSQFALKGTAKPTYYNVLYDEIFRSTFGEAKAAETLQKLTMNLCFAFQRSTTAVGLCPPAYYADILCERAHAHQSAQELALRQKLAKTSSDSGARSAAKANRSLAQVHHKIKDTMFYI